MPAIAPPGQALGWLSLPLHSTARALRQAGVAGVQRAAGNHHSSRLATAGPVQRDHHTPEARRERAARESGGEGQAAATPWIISAPGFDAAAREFRSIVVPRVPMNLLVMAGRSLRAYDESGAPRSRRTFRLESRIRASPGVYTFVETAEGRPLNRWMVDANGRIFRGGFVGAPREEGESRPGSGESTGEQPAARGEGAGASESTPLVPIADLGPAEDQALADVLQRGAATFYIVPRIPRAPRPDRPFGEASATELGIAGPPPEPGMPRDRRGRANRPAWPAEIRGEELQAPGGIGTFAMRLDYSGADADLLTQASAASNLVLYRWKIWDVTRRARERGVTTTEGASELVESGEAGRGAEVEQGIAAGVRREHVIREQWEDIEHGVEDLGPALVVLGPLAVLSAASSAIVAAGGELIDTLADSMGGFSEEREIPWPEREGAYLIQSIAYPRPQGENGEIRYLPSRARKLVFVQNPRRLAQSELIRPEREVEELEERISHERNAEERARLQEQLETARVNVQGSAIDVLEHSLDRLRRQLAALPAWDIYRRRDLERDRDRMQRQLERARERTEGATSVIRPRGVLVSRVSGQRYPLLLQLMDLGQRNGAYRYRLSDMTDRSGGAYEGEGSSRDAAVDDAIRAMANECGYGRGLLVIRIFPGAGDPGRFPSPGDRRVQSAPRDLALAREKLNDLVTILVALGMFAPGVGEVAAVAGALLAAERLVNRYRLGTLEADAESFSDTVSILGGVIQVGQAVGRLRLAQHGRRFTLSLEGGDAAAAMRAARGGERVRAATRGLEVAGRAVDRIDLISGNMQTLNQLLEVNREERTGQITHTEARRRRSHIASQAIHTNAMAIYGHIRETMVAEGGPAPDAGPPRPGEVGPIPPRQAGETPGGRAPNEAPDLGPNERPPGPEPEPRARGRRPAEEGRAETPEGEARRPAEGEEEETVRTTLPGPTAAPPVETPERMSLDEAVRRFTRTLERGQADRRAGAAEDLIRAAGDWRGELRRVVAELPDARRQVAELALIEARQRLVDRTFARLQQEFPGVFMFNPGTVSFASDIDITLRPVEQRPGFSGEPRPLAGQLNESSRASLRFAELLRTALGGETDAIIDTNVYAYIGEQSFAARTARERRAEAALAGEVGMAEQIRGLGPEQWSRFRSRLEAELAAARSPEAAAAQRALLRQMERAEAFFAARETERTAAETQARQENPGAPAAVVARIAREQIVAAKRERLAELAAAQPPNFAEIARLQSEILWFEPEAYATRSAFEQAVAQGQALRAAGAESGSEALRENIGQQRARLEELRSASPRDEAAIRRAEEDLAYLERQLEAGRWPEEAVRSDIETIQEREAARTRGRTPADALAHSAGAASANFGMMVGHIEAAGDNLAAAVKAAAKYGGRILRAEHLAGVEASSPETRALLDLFLQSRWTIFEGAAQAAMMERLLVRYARQAGMHDQITSSPGRPSTVSDAVRRQFVDNIRRWAEGAVGDLHRMAAETAERQRAEAGVMGPAAPRDGGGGAGAPPRVPSAEGERARRPAETPARSTPGSGEPEPGAAGRARTHREAEAEVERLAREGVATEPPPRAAVEAARQRVENGAGTRADIELLLQQAVADFRAYQLARLVQRPAVAPESRRLGSEQLAGACGPGRDVSADAFQSLTLDSAELVTIHRFQAGDFITEQSHGFAVVTFGGPPPLRFIVDPTFAQFVREPPEPRPGQPVRQGMRGRFTAGRMLAEATGASLARDLVRDGFLHLATPEVARLYALGLGASPEQARQVAQALWGGESSVPQGAILSESIANGEILRRETPVGPGEIPELHLLALAGDDELLDVISTMLGQMPADDPLRPQLQALHIRLTALEEVQRRSPIRSRTPSAAPRR
ncbi:MAG: hypothetical protein HS107_11225 [Thermoflexaceae bacterium]|nr:hypothetical protein [Thermoflexaceae bacterium]